jgi:hypothetical protein
VQPRYAQNNECVLLPSYEGANNRKCCALVPKLEADKKEARKSIHSVLNTFKARMSFIVREGKVGAIGTTNEEATGYYFVKWLSKPYTLHADTEGMSGIILIYIFSENSHPKMWSSDVVWKRRKVMAVQREV